MNIIDKLLTVYWSQLILLIAGIGYLVRYYMGLKSKKIETSYLLFHQNKINAINHYLECLAKAEQLWNHFSIYDFVDKKKSPNEVDEEIYPVLNSIKSAEMKVNIYLNHNESLYIESLTKTVYSVNKILLKFFSNQELYPTRIHKINDFNEALDLFNEEVKDILPFLYNEIKRSFNEKA